MAAGLLLSLPCGAGAAAVPRGTTSTESGLQTEPWSTQKLQLCWKQLMAQPWEGPGHTAVAGVYTWVPCALAPVPVPAPHAIGLPAPTAAAATMGSAGGQDRGLLSRHQLLPVPTPVSADDRWCLSLPMPIAAGGPAPLLPWHRARCTPCTCHPRGLPGQLSLISPFPPSGMASHIPAVTLCGKLPTACPWGRPGAAALPAVRWPPWRIAQRRTAVLWARTWPPSLPGLS